MIDFKLNKELVLSLVFFVLVVLFGFWSLIALTPLIFVVLFRVFKNKATIYNITLLDLAFAFSSFTPRRKAELSESY